MWLLTNAWQRMLRRVLVPLGLTHVQYTVLASVAYLSRDERPVSQADVCRFGSMDRNMVSEVVRSLVARGLIERAAHPRDARALRLGLTAQGELAYAEARALVKPQAEGFYAPLGEEVGDLVRLLARLNEAQRLDDGADLD